MSDPDAYSSEMKRVSRLTDKELDLLVTGRVTEKDSDLQELAILLDEVGSTNRVCPNAVTEARHLAAIHDASQLLAGNHHQAPTTAGQLPEAGKPSSARRGRKPLLIHPFAALGAKIAVAVAVALGALGGTAYAGVLPDKVQNVVSDVGNAVGVPIPTGENSDPGVDDGQVGNTDNGQVGNTDDGQQGQREDSQAGDTNDGQQGQHEDSQAGDTNDGQQGDSSNADQGSSHTGSHTSSNDGSGNSNGGGNSDGGENNGGGTSQGGSDQNGNGDN